MYLTQRLNKKSSQLLERMPRGTYAAYLTKERTSLLALSFALQKDALFAPAKVSSGVAISLTLLMSQSIALFSDSFVDVIYFAEKC